jgi:hypothetical protein
MSSIDLLASQLASAAARTIQLAGHAQEGNNGKQGRFITWLDAQLNQAS